MPRTQTLVQLSDELVERLDARARQIGVSRSAVVREAVVAYLDQLRHDDDVVRYVEGYRALPPAPDDWGDLGVDADRAGRALAVRLTEEERRTGTSW